MRQALPCRWAECPDNKDGKCQYQRRTGRKLPCRADRFCHFAPRTVAPRARKTEQKQKAMELYRSGMSATAVAKKLNISHKTVLNWRDEDGIPAHKPRVYPGAGLEVARLYHAGLTDSEIASQLGIAKGTVRDHRYKRGLLRKRGRRK